MVAKVHYPWFFLSQQTLLDRLWLKKMAMFLDNYALRGKIIAYVKDEGSNFNNMTITLKLIINCDVLGSEESFHGTCFGHAVSMAHQYVIIKEKNCKNLRYVSIKSPQKDL